MPVKYAVRITKDNFALIQALRPVFQVEVKEDPDRYFLFQVNHDYTTSEHDIMHEDDLYHEDGYLKIDAVVML